MEYFAGLDVSMDETHICVVDRDGSVVLETKTTTSPAAIASGLALARRLAIIMHAILRHGTEFKAA
jgi:hypothetical protein